MCSRYLLRALSVTVGGARNLAITMAPTEWVFISDLDMLIPPRMPPQLLRLMKAEAELLARTTKSTAKSAKGVRGAGALGSGRRLAGMHGDLSLIHI